MREDGYDNLTETPFVGWRGATMEFVLSKSRLRPWLTGDEESLVLHANNRLVWRNLRDAFPHPYTIADARQWIQIANPSPPITNFAIIVEGAAVGGIGVVLKDDVFRRSAEIGYWLGEEFWGRGIVTEAVREVTEYAFTTFDLCRIYAGVFEWNPASMRVLEKAGYEFECRMRKSVTKDGETVDELIYAVVRV
jgi:ribosomal-protein-alanine N-acetyltransferase